MAKMQVGEVYGNLTVLQLTEGTRASGKPKYMAVCRCTCGSEVEIERHNLKTGNTSKCKDCAKITRAENRRRHGHSMSRKDIDPEGYGTYTIWQAMKRRCNNPTDRRYADYGGRGITVCEAWQDSYEQFLSDMGIRPTPQHQIDRIDNDGPYSPENCRWSTRMEQASNKRNNRLITAFGQSKTATQWARDTGIQRKTITRRIDLYGMTPEEAVTLKPHERKRKTA